VIGDGGFSKSPDGIAAFYLDILKSFLNLRDLLDSFLDGAHEGGFFKCSLQASLHPCFSHRLLQAFGLRAFI
jgi:hypothetical protein